MFSPPVPSLTMPRRIGFVILSAMFGVATVIAIVGRGPWYDEFYAVYLVRPGVPLSALVPAWLRDNHPPLFYALAWAWSQLIAGTSLAGTVEGLRTVNLVILAGLIGAFVRMARTDTWFARIVWYDCVALAATFPALDRIDQVRSYFLSFALAAIVLPLLVRHIMRRVERRETLILGVLLAFACSVHLVTTVIITALVVATVAQHMLACRWDDARRLAMVAALALVPFAVMMMLQLSTIVANTHVFWIPGGINAARWAIETEAHAALFANPALMLVAAAGLASIAAGLRRHETEAQTTAILITTFTAALVLALTVLIAVHLYRPLLITRYLVALDPVFALILAVCADAATRKMPVRIVVAIDALILLVTGFALHANCVATLAQPSWDGTGTAIAANIRACPQTTVHADMHWNTLPLSTPPRDNRDVVPFSYRFVAQRFGFALAPTGAYSLSATCPNLFWTEHAADQHPTAQMVIDAIRRAGYPVRSGRMQRIAYGWILITPPIRSSSRAIRAPHATVVRHARSG